MAGKTYAEKLKDPRWQKMRLEVLERENWECERCFSGEKTLHVHHSYYERDLDPWEYPSYSLACLCEDCHEIAQQEMLELHRGIGRMRISSCCTQQVLGYIDGMRTQSFPNMRLTIGDDNMYACGVGSAYGLTASPILEWKALDGTISGNEILDQMNDVKEGWQTIGVLKELLIPSKIRKNYGLPKRTE